MVRHYSASMCSLMMIILLDEHLLGQVYCSTVVPPIARSCHRTDSAVVHCDALYRTVQNIILRTVKYSTPYICMDITRGMYCTKLYDQYSMPLSIAVLHWHSTLAQYTGTVQEIVYSSLRLRPTDYRQAPCHVKLHV